jgi:tetratricopeptide (TPR) repeat protein
MFARAYHVALLTAGLLCSTGIASAQTGRLAGKVIGEDGQPLQGAIVHVERQEMPGKFQVKTNKRGEYLFGFLQMGVYNVSLEVDGVEKARVNNIKPSSAGEATQLDFDLAKEAANRKAAASGQLTEQQLGNMTPEQRKRYEERLSKRREQLSRNKELNDSYNAGMEALGARNYTAAIASFKTAAEIDPKQVAVWAQLATAHSGFAGTKRGAEAKATRAESIAAYRKALEFQPDNAGFHNNIGLELIKDGQMEEGKQELANAALLSPNNAGQFHYNLGATLMNQGDVEGAISAFRDATTVTPPYAEAFYQIGLSLMGQAKVDDNGNTIPVEGTIEAFQNYLQNSPNGPNAPTAKSLITSLQSSVDMSFENPNARKRRRRKQ